MVNFGAVTNNVFKRLGPGLLYAGAAIGVSHLVMSTRAGAMHGYILIAAIIIIHILKYPLLKLGPIYTQKTGNTLVQGLTSLGWPAKIILLFITVSTLFIIQAAVTIVTSALLAKVFHLQNLSLFAAAILTFCILLIAIGRYKALDLLMKGIIVILSITTIIAVIASFKSPFNSAVLNLDAFDWSDKKHLFFLIAFLGWMPAPLDITLWHSIWTKEKMLGEKSFNQNNSTFDFNVGFFGTAFLAICFVVLGANFFYSSGIELSNKAAVFAGQILDIYSTTLGDFFFWIAAIAAITTMFSTTLTCLDAMPKVTVEIIKNAWSTNGVKPKNLKIATTILTGLGALIIIHFFGNNLKAMVDFATTVSFLSAPFIAGMCILLVNRTSKGLWTKWEQYLAMLGFIVLTVLSTLFIWYTFLN